MTVRFEELVRRYCRQGYQYGDAVSMARFDGERAQLWLGREVVVDGKWLGVVDDGPTRDRNHRGDLRWLWLVLPADGGPGRWVEEEALNVVTPAPVSAQRGGEADGGQMR